eukprot:1657481-Pleurochrysis_carterae.AAC.1
MFPHSRSHKAQTRSHMSPARVYTDFCSAPPIVAGLTLYARHLQSDACLVAAAPPRRRIALVARSIADSVSLGASAPPPLTFSCVAARAMPANTLRLPSVQAVASCRRIS